MNSSPRIASSLSSAQAVRSSLKKLPPAELIQMPGLAHQLFMPKP
jgi:hypothetical protein